MLVSVENRVYQIPEPFGGDSEIVIKVDKYAFIPIQDKIRQYQFGFTNALSKLIFHIFREGVKLTIKKIIFYRLQRKIERLKQVMFVSGRTREEGKLAIGIGPQTLPLAEYLAFPKDLVMLMNQSKDVKKDFQLVLEYFQKNPDKLEFLYHFSPYSGNKLDIKLENILKKQEDQLTSKKPFQPSLEAIRFNEKPIAQKRKKRKISDYDLFIAGAGSYPFSYILPFIKGVNFHTIIDINPLLATIIGNRFCFESIDTSFKRALSKLKDSKNPLLVVATYHSSHFAIVEEALSVNTKTKIMLEKPPVTSEDQLEKLLSLRDNSKHFVEIGYNRRYIPFVTRAKNIIDRIGGPKTVTCIIKELNIPGRHWYYWPSQGTRVTGNLCHWIDLGLYFIQRNPTQITAISASDKFPADEISVAIQFEDGSLLTLIASDRGNRLRGVQEYIDIRCGNLTLSIDDFIKMRVQEGGHQRVYRSIRRNKGHVNMYKSFMQRIHRNEKPAYPNWDLKTSTELYLMISDLLLKNKRTAPFNSNH